MNVGDTVRSKASFDVAAMNDLIRRRVTYSVEAGEEGTVIEVIDRDHCRVQFVSGTAMVNLAEIEKVPCTS